MILQVEIDLCFLVIISSDSMARWVTSPPCTCNHTTTHGGAFTACRGSCRAPLWTWQPVGDLKTGHNWILQVPLEASLVVSTRPGLWMSSLRPCRKCRRREKPQRQSAASPTRPQAVNRPQVWERKRSISAISLASARVGAVALISASQTTTAPALDRSGPKTVWWPQLLPGYHPDPKPRRSWPAAPPWPARRRWPPRPNSRISFQSQSTAVSEWPCNT